MPLWPALSVLWKTRLASREAASGARGQNRLPESSASPRRGLTRMRTARSKALLGSWGRSGPGSRPFCTSSLSCSETGQVWASALERAGLDGMEFGLQIVPAAPAAWPPWVLFARGCSTVPLVALTYCRVALLETASQEASVCFLLQGQLHNLWAQSKLEMQEPRSKNGEGGIEGNIM